MKDYGTWVGLDRFGNVQAACMVLGPTDDDDDEARAFVTPGSVSVQLLPPGATVRLGSPLPARPEGEQ